MKQDIKQQRSPIVVILGHVDHGKTTLLDKVRSSNIAAREAGGITQSIGAWQVKTKEGKRITFIDTPGHEAFRAMRARGANIADTAVLVVAADDGVMPQTKESIKYIKEAKIPFLVAITKTDLPAAQPDKVKSQLLKEEVLLEGYGGDVVAVETSGKTGKGIDELLEMILLLAEMSRVTGDANSLLEAPVIEARLDRRKGVVVHAVVRNGSLNVGDMVSAEGLEAKVRGIFDEYGKAVGEVLPGQPAEVLGFSSVPAVGSVLRPKGQETGREAGEKARIVKEDKGLPIIIKADTQGSLEAITASLGDKVRILFSGVGDITETDIVNASLSQAVIVGFSVRVSKEIEKLAQEQGVIVHSYKVIYELLQDVDKWLKEKEELEKEKILGRAQVMAEFRHGKEKIAGCRMLEGKITSASKLRLVRDGVVLENMRPSSIRKNKEKVDKVGEGEEFGILFQTAIDFKVGDVIESWQLPKS